LGGQSASYLGHLNADGTVDTNFTAAASGTIYSMALQTNGQILVGGAFTSLDGSACNYLGRLNANGTLDTTFSPSPNSTVSCLAIQPNGQILAVGSFYAVHNWLSRYLVRLNSNGTPDTTFNPQLNNTVYSLALQADGKILAGGSFTSVAGATQDYVVRLNTNGTQDQTFICGTYSATAYSVMMQPNGEVLIGGAFGGLYDSKGEHPDGSLGRLFNTLTPTQTLSYAGSTITWSCSATSPQFAWVVFESSNDGTNWSLIGNGSYTGTGWQLSGVSQPATNSIRGRGLVIGGEYDGSSYFLEKVIPVNPLYPPAILVNDGNFSRTTNGIGFDVAALVGQSVLVESSTNLVNWSILTTNQVSANPFYFFDTSAMTSPAKYYRLRLQ
jgi:uncharacterized delta-60 repeat protein